MRSATFLGLAFLVACGSGGGDGSVRVELSGEEAAVSGYPAGDIAFADGFTMTVDRVVVSITGFHLRGIDGDDAMVAADPIVADLHLGEPEAWVLDGVPARRWDDTGYVYGPPTAASRNVNGVAQADIDRMIAAGWSILFEGTATDGTESYTFSYGLDLRLDNDRCLNGMDETDGIVVRPNSVTPAQITVHLDHLFFDSYASDDASLRFEPMAAAAGADMHVDLDELAAQPLADLRTRAGQPLVDAEGNPVVYDPGPLTLRAPNLREYVRAAATTTGHFNGEGHCEYVIR
jgi:hypothetical protein